MIEINTKYRHYKGGEYKVLAVGKHSETQEEMVVYQGLYDPYPVWIRPKSMFEDNVESKDFNYSGLRFRKID